MANITVKDLTTAMQIGRDEQRKNNQQIANDALYPSYGDSWKNEIDTGPTDPEPGEPVFGTEEGGQTFFEFVKSLQIDPKQLAHLIHKIPDGFSMPSQQHHDPKEHESFNPSGERMYDDGSGNVVPWDQRPEGFEVSDAKDLTKYLDSLGRSQKTGSFRDSPIKGQDLIDALKIGKQLLEQA